MANFFSYFFFRWQQPSGRRSLDLTGLKPRHAPVANSRGAVVQRHEHAARDVLLQVHAATSHRNLV